MSGADQSLVCDDDLTTSDLSKILITKGVTGAISFFACIITIISFCCCLKFNVSFKQRVPKDGTGKIVHRLVICMAIYAIFRSVAVTIQVAAKSEGGLCQFLGFLDQWSVWAMLLVVQMIVIYLMVQVCKCSCCVGGCNVALCGNTTKSVDDDYHDSHTEANRCGCCKESKYNEIVLQVFYFLFPILFPLVFNWVPFIRSSYGLSGGWCWIRIENEDCSEFRLGLLEQVGFWFFWLVIAQIIDVVFLLAYPCLVCDAVENGKRFKLCLQQAPLIMTLILSILINLVSLVNRIVIGSLSADHKNLGAWIFHAIASSFWGIFATMVILFYMCMIRWYRSPRRQIKEAASMAINHVA